MAAGTINPDEEEKEEEKEEVVPFVEEEKSELDNEIFEWHNKCREDPKSIIPDLEERLEQFCEDGITRRFDGRIIESREGVEAIKELIEFL